MAASGKSVPLVVLDFPSLVDTSRDLSTEIEAAFGEAGLGIIAVKDVPGYTEARGTLLPLAERLEQLPAEAKDKLEDPKSVFSFGWSFGKEALVGGKKDLLKGSFYANPIWDTPTLDSNLIEKYPAYCRQNLWPREDLPELEPAFKNLGKIVVDVGQRLVEHCDRFVAAKAQEYDPDFKGGLLSASLARSRTHKGRLLQYLPATPSEDEASEPGTVPDTKASDRLWCAWHLDHGSLTGLTRAQYRCNGVEVPPPDTVCGLYVRKQDGSEVQVPIPEDCIAFQMGQAMSIMSGGLLCATPHCVRAANGLAASPALRATFAVFMQPMWDEPLVPPPGVTPSEGTRKTWGLWQPGMDFGEFSEKTLGAYYG